MVDSTLFILFGRGIDGTFSSSLIIIDVADASDIAYQSSYSLSVNTLGNAAGNHTGTNTGNETRVVNNNGNNNTNSEYFGGSFLGLSSGAIGGISAGGAIVVSGCARISIYSLIIANHALAYRYHCISILPPSPKNR